MTELAAVAAIYPHMQSLEAEVLAISTDSVHAHKVFKQTNPALKDIGFPLVSDRTQEISKAYGLLNIESGAAQRASVFIGPHQLINAKLIYPEAIGRNIPEHLRLLQALQYQQKTGKGTPVNWVPS